MTSRGPPAVGTAAPGGPSFAFPSIPRFVESLPNVPFGGYGISPPGGQIYTGARVGMEGFHGQVTHTEEGRLNIHATVIATAATDGDPMSDFGTGLPCFVATQQFRNLRKVPTAHVRMKTIVALNRYLASEEGMNKFGAHRDPYVKAGVLSEWNLFGVQQTNVNDRAFGSARTYPINMQAGQRAMVPNLWHPRFGPGDRHSTKEYVMPGTRLWLLVVKRVYDDDDDAEEAAESYIGKRSRDGTPLRWTQQPGDRRERPRLADEMDAPAYWSIEPWSSIDSKPPPQELYNKGDVTGAALYFGMVTDLYKNHQNVSPSLGTLLDQALFGHMSTAEAQQVMDNAPRLEVMMGSQ